MEPYHIVLIAALLFCLVCSAFFSASETAYSSLNRIRLKSLAAEGNKKATKALQLSAQYDKLLSSVLIGNNIVNIASTSIATVLFVALLGSWGPTVATAVMTVLVLIFGEISPKTLAKEAPEQFAMLAAGILNGIMVVLTPVNKLLSSWKRLIVKLFRIGGKRTTTEAELLTYVEEVRQEGGINQQEEDMIRQVIEFDDLRAIDIITPRVDVVAVAEDDTPEDISNTFYATGFSRLPVYRGNIDNIVGVVLQKDFHFLMENRHLSIASIIKPILYITKSVKISELLRLLQQKKSHMAVIADEFGGTLGIVTVEDIVEELVGEIWDEHDDIVQDIRPLQNGCFQVQGSTDLEDLFEFFDIKKADNFNCATAGGWAVELLGHLPAEGEQFTYKNLLCTVARVARHRVLEITIQPAPTKDEQSPFVPARGSEK